MKNKTVKVYHPDLLDLCNKFGYPITEGGLCKGFSMMAAQAFFAKDFKTFSERLDVIGQYLNCNDGFDTLIKDLNTIKQKIIQKQKLTIEEQRLSNLQIPAFFETLSLYQVPDKHSDLLSGQYKQSNMDIIFNVAKSSTLEDNALSTELEAPFAFNKIELIQFLERLAHIIQNNPDETSINLSSGNHAVYLSLSKNKLKNKTTWDFIDTNDFKRHENSAYIRTLTTEDLANSLLVSLFSANNNEIVTNIQILSASPKIDEQNKEEKKEQDEEEKNIFLKLVGQFPVQEDHLKIYNKYGIGLMHIACQYEHEEIVQELLKINPSYINMEDKEGITPLHLACLTGNLKIIQLLLLNNADINKANKDGITPLGCACQEKHYAIVQVLLDNKADINKENSSGMTRLHSACLNGDLELTQILLKSKKIEINKVDKNGKTPLHYACQKKHHEVFQELLKNGDINVNLSDNDGLTPLHLACINGDLELVQELIKKGAHLNQQCKKGNTALLYACQKGHLNIIQELLNNPEVNVNHANKDGLTPLHYACAKGFLEVVQELLNNEYIKVHQADKDGDTALHFAAGSYKVQPHIIEELLKHSDVNTASKEGFTPLHYACQKGNVEAIQILLNNGAEINQTTSVTKNTPLHEACLSAAQTYDNKELFILLLSKRADISQKNSNGETALDIASKNYNQAAIKVIIDYAMSNKIELSTIMSKSTKGSELIKKAIKQNTISAFEKFKMQVSALSMFKKKVKDPEIKPKFEPKEKVNPSENNKI